MPSSTPNYTSGLPRSLPRAIATPTPMQHHRQSISGNTLARSFIYSSFKPVTGSPLLSGSLMVHSSDSVHEHTADLADVAVPDFDKNAVEDDSFSNSPNAKNSYEYDSNNNLEEFPSNNDFNYSSNENNNETSTLQNYNLDNYGSIIPNAEDSQSVYTSHQIDIESNNKIQQNSFSFKQKLEELKSWDRDTIIDQCVYKPVSYLPAVFLGTLLNVLDALSYGMIMFPIGELAFSSMGPIGLSMFYVSTVISQLVYSCGGSAFKSGIGSEMIEVTPFFHQMAISIMLKLGSEEGEDINSRIITTTMFTFAISSIVTGLCFAILGKCRLGKLVGFFPRHILVGCIGGVGYFLFVTGIEVSSRIEGGIEYNLPTLEYLFEPLSFLQWTVPLILATILIFLQHYNNSPLIVPLYFIGVFVVFHLLVFIIPSWSLQAARDFGWVFGSQKSDQPWYEFYKYYDFKKADWLLILDQVPTMLALTFFGVLHVPINVPALALTVGMDNFDVDRELIAHGISNLLSGFLGSIQNYLVYTNSVLFIRAGADSRLSGIMLAMATMLILWIGPSIIGYIPICVVGSLIYLLGYELLKEAIWDTIGRLRKFEYATIIIIVITMGAWDFVYGILVGILLACVSFVIEAGSRRVISDIYTGEYARSIVVRNPKQQEFLRNVGKQICILKLSGSLFFGSIGGLEEEVRTMFNYSNYKKQPIKYLILDINNVLTIDFSAAEGFKRIRNLLLEKNCYFLISSVNEDSSIFESLKFCGLWEDEEHEEKIQLFNNLNSALEWSENMFLSNYRDLLLQRQQFQKEFQIKKKLPISLFDSNSNSLTNSGDTSPIVGSPRHIQFLKAAKKSIKAEQQQQDLLLKSIKSERKTSLSNMKQPLLLILQIMQGLSEKVDENFWNKLCPYLKKQNVLQDELIYDKNLNQPNMFFFEQGLISFEIVFRDLQFKINSSELPLTLFGDLVMTRSDRSLKYFAKTECVLWKLDSAGIEKLKIENSKLYEELLTVSVRLAVQRYDAISSNILIS